MRYVSSIDIFKGTNEAYSLASFNKLHTMSDIAENLPFTGTPGERVPAQEYQKNPDNYTWMDKDLALRLSALIEDANGRVAPLCRMIRKVCLFFLVFAGPSRRLIRVLRRPSRGSKRRKKMTVMRPHS